MTEENDNIDDTEILNSSIDWKLEKERPYAQHCKDGGGNSGITKLSFF